MTHNLQPILDAVRRRLEGTFFRRGHEWSIEIDPTRPNQDDLWIVNVLVKTDHQNQAGYYAWLCSGEIDGCGNQTVDALGKLWTIGDGDDYNAAQIEGDTVRFWVRWLDDEEQEEE